MLADLMKLKGTVESPVNHDSAGHEHEHAMLSAAARLVEAVHASDAHGVHSALKAHHEAWTSQREADDSEA